MDIVLATGGQTQRADTTNKRSAGRPESRTSSPDAKRLAIGEVEVSNNVIEPVVIEPVAIVPIDIEPVVIEAVVIQPVAIDPLVYQPVAIQSSVIEPFAMGVVSRAIYSGDRAPIIPIFTIRPREYVVGSSAVDIITRTQRLIERYIRNRQNIFNTVWIRGMYMCRIRVRNRFNRPCTMITVPIIVLLPNYISGGGSISFTRYRCSTSEISFTRICVRCNDHLHAEQYSQIRQIIEARGISIKEVTVYINESRRVNLNRHPDGSYIVKCLTYSIRSRVAFRICIKKFVV